MLHIRTPLILHPQLSTPTRRIWLKLENLQPCGSFKMRGIGVLCQRAQSLGKHRVICASGGNAGFATAMAASRLGLQSTIVVPNTTPEQTRTRISAAGAQVIVEGEVWDEANRLAMQLAEHIDSQYIPAFDDPEIWRGHSTMIDEILQDCPAVDAMVCAVGGGGLLAGVLTGLARNDRLDCRVVACETQGAASFAAAVKAGRPVRLSHIDTIAKTLAATQVAAWPVANIQRFEHRCVQVSDAQATLGVARYAEDLRQLVEPACGAALVLAYLDHTAIADRHDIVVIVCGGVSINAALVADWTRGLEH